MAEEVFGGCAVIILGIDPGTATTGYGLVTEDDGRRRRGCCAAASSTTQRRARRCRSACWRSTARSWRVIRAFGPDAVAVEVAVLRPQRHHRR